MNFHTRRFDRAAGSYAAHADFQAGMAERLLSGLPNDLPAAGPLIEFGCGTGHLTALLSRRFPDADLLATDAAPRMLGQAERSLGKRAGLRFAICDASGAVPAPGPIAGYGPYRLAASNALVQWFPDLVRHLRCVSGLLAPGGCYLASGFDRSNFPELNSILGEAPFGYADFPGHPASDLGGLAAEAGLELAMLESERRETVYPSPRAFLEGIRALGAARRPREGSPMTRSRLELLLRRYQERYPRERGVAATWAPWYAAFRKPG
ncbi:MAG: methyltransferase [Fibrobacteres bacterium]|jgi:malonyl-CoA O-methyltransferase|nr:methyltransferase [Fibrobacterota bacterium]